MYYRKYFSGVIDTLANTVGTTLTSAATGGGGATSGYYRSLKTTPVLCNAIVEVLREIGLTEAVCRLDPGDPATYGEIFPYGEDTQGIHVFFGYTAYNNVNNHTSLRVMVCADTYLDGAKSATDSYGYSATLQIASATSGTDVAYRFYVTVKGDPTSFLQVMVSSYLNIDTETTVIGFGKGRDCFGNRVVAYAVYSLALYFFDLDKKTYANQLTPTKTVANSAVSQAISDVLVKGCPDDAVALIPWTYMQLLGVTLDGCYCVPVSLTTATTDQAFLIGGEEYWLLRNGRLLARCPTKLNL